MVTQFIRVCRADEVEEGRIKPVKVNGREIILTRISGSVYALENICSHDGGILGGGVIADGQIECPRHGAHFDIKTGEATRMPAVADIETFEVKEDDGQILVSE
jgi:3-phenylpropionate/trans-cinnamate dioxygenase ferredoxin subunit